MGVQGGCGDPGDMELRHLTPTDRCIFPCQCSCTYLVPIDRRQLCDILEHGDGWRRVMGVVPRSRIDRTNKYSADQVSLRG